MDKYVKLGKLGQGSFGCAFLVARKSDPDGRKLVVKEVRMDPRDEQRALREARLLAALDHPNIIACKESFVLPARARGSEQVLCIVTEFADGGDLRQALRRRRQGPAAPRFFEEHEVLDLFVQVCLALRHLHERRILHRDVKPENIFLSGASVVKLGDLGVATVLSHTLASAGTRAGTPYYSSPEICLGRRYNSKTDVWSLGCVLYELATLGQRPFDGRSQRQLFDRITRAAHTPLAAALAGSPARYSAALGALVDAMLAKRPADRPSVAALLRTPVVAARIRRFLCERALADELRRSPAPALSPALAPPPAPVAATRSKPAAVRPKPAAVAIPKAAAAAVHPKAALRRSRPMNPRAGPAGAKAARPQPKKPAVRSKARAQAAVLDPPSPPPPPPPPARLPASRAPAAAARAYPKPVEVRAQGLRQHIRAQKQALAGGAAASPLDAPVILVQSLRPAAAAESPAAEPPAPAHTAAPPDGGNGEPTSDQQDEGASRHRERPWTVPAAERIEYERMVLQLRSAVEAADDESEDESESEGESEDEPDDAPSSLTLDAAALETDAFKRALRLVLGDAERTAEALAELPPALHPTLRWMRSYVAAVMTATATAPSESEADTCG